MSSLSVKNLSFSYGQREVLHNISLEAREGEFLSILGCNGVGKSTLFRCMLGLLEGYSGEVLVDNKNIKSMAPGEIASYIAYIPQTSAPVFNYSVEDMVLFGTTAGMGRLSSPGREEMERVDSALRRMGIESYRERCFHQLSGGEKQLVIIARAIAQNAKILMLDEPTASLDFGNQMLVLKQIRSLADEGYTVIQTTHNPEHSYMFSDSITAIKNGSILIDAEPEKVLTKEIISSIYGIDVDINSLYEDRVRVCTAIF